jgi:hypothetical protein
MKTPETHQTIDSIPPSIRCHWSPGHAATKRTKLATRLARTGFSRRFLAAVPVQTLRSSEGALYQYTHSGILGNWELLLTNCRYVRHDPALARFREFMAFLTELMCRPRTLSPSHMPAVRDSLAFIPYVLRFLMPIVGAFVPPLPDWLINQAGASSIRWAKDPRHDKMT